MSGNFLIDPIDFMNKNLVIVNYNSLGKTQQDAGVQTMCLVKSAKKAKQHGVELDIYSLTRHSSRLPSKDVEAIFDAYWCPYEQNQTLHCMLGTEARYMFTATMDGCSFGVGSQNNGVCRVAHSNEGTFGGSREGVYGTNGARVFQHMEQANRLQYEIPNLTGIIAPNAYQQDYDGEYALTATTFGIRNNTNTWEFYTQKYWKSGVWNPTYFLRTVDKHF